MYMWHTNNPTVDVVTRNTSVDALTGTAAKPSFLMWDKVYQKITDMDDETWLLRAIDLVLDRLSTELTKSENLRLAPYSICLSTVPHPYIYGLVGWLFVILYFAGYFSDPSLYTWLSIRKFPRSAEAPFRR